MLPWNTWVGGSGGTGRIANGFAIGESDGGGQGEGHGGGLRRFISLDSALPAEADMWERQQGSGASDGAGDVGRVRDGGGDVAARDDLSTTTEPAPKAGGTQKWSNA